MNDLCPKCRMPLKLDVMETPSDNGDETEGAHHGDT